MSPIFNNYYMGDGFTDKELTILTNYIAEANRVLRATREHFQMVRVLDTAELDDLEADLRQLHGDLPELRDMIINGLHE